MIDVHVLTHEGTKPEWLDECLKSLANEPCTVHVLDNTGCTVGQGRAKGYRLGFHPFVTYVDSDDHVFPGVMAAVCDALQTHDSVCTAEVAMLDGVEFFKNRDRGHALFAAWRDATTPLLDHMETVPYASDLLVRRHLKPHRIGFLGYSWRIHDGQAHRKIDGAMLRREFERCPWQN